MQKIKRYATTPIFQREESNIFKVESMLAEILKWNNNLEIPIVKSIKNNVTRKIIRCFFYASKFPVALGFAGETASGKTTIANELISALENFAHKESISNLITKINMDNYYYDRSKEVIAAGSFDKFVEDYDLDSPSAFELDLFAMHLSQLKKGQTIYTPEYDMSGTAKRYEDKILTLPAQIIVTEGLYTFSEVSGSCFDVKFYVDIDEEIQKKRWYKRAKERDLGKSADKVYQNALEKAQIYIRPTKNEADIVLNGEASIASYKIFIDKILDIVKEIKMIKKSETTLELVRS